MTLADHIATLIAANGPISIAEYMQECLLHPTMGYYTTQKPFGAEGDFITAPEISQMFGELIGLCLAQTWMDQGCPSPFILAELGPGRGTLMADVLRATKAVPDFLAAADIHLIEASPRLQDIQRATLSSHTPNFTTLDALPDQPVFFIANEFFDALPIRQFQRAGTGWRERQIGVQGADLTLGLGPVMPQPALADRLTDTKEGDIVEHAARAGQIIASLGQRIASHGGAGLVIDYGDWRSLGDTLQAVKAHQHVGILDAPGTCDLTAHVDFEALARATPCAYSKLTPQGVFLERLGITNRATALAKPLEGAALDTHIRAHRRLTHPDEMGNLFKVLGLFPQGMPPPAGLES